MSLCIKTMMYGNCYLDKAKLFVVNKIIPQPHPKIKKEENAILNFIRYWNNNVYTRD